MTVASEASKVDLLPTFLGPGIQLAFVVKDLDAALRFWTEEMQVGPFVVFEESLGERQFVHRGQPSDVKMSVALSYRGDTQIELITQSNGAPSLYSEFFARGGEGLQHIAFAADDYEQACRRLEHSGFQEVSSIQTRDGVKNVSYYVGPAHFGVMVEVVPMTPARQKYYGTIRALAQTWDGSRPVRKFRNSAEFMASDECR